MLKVMIVPRQAWDKHPENSKKTCVFRRAVHWAGCWLCEREAVQAYAREARGPSRWRSGIRRSASRKCLLGHGNVSDCSVPPPPPPPAMAQRSPAQPPSAVAHLNFAECVCRNHHRVSPRSCSAGVTRSQRKVTNQSQTKSRTDREKAAGVATLTCQCIPFNWTYPLPAAAAPPPKA
eukprot:COSAG06_NODE_415_length_15998_cov_3.107428_17_plen_177_part_00